MLAWFFVGHPCFQRATSLGGWHPRPRPKPCGGGVLGRRLGRRAAKEPAPCGALSRSFAASLSLAGVRSGGGIIGTRGRASSADPGFPGVFLKVSLSPCLARVYRPGVPSRSCACPPRGRSTPPEKSPEAPLPVAPPDPLASTPDGCGAPSLDLGPPQNSLPRQRTDRPWLP